MFGSLRKKLEEATAQLNPFDGGKTASTVRAARNQAPPAQTVKNPNQQSVDWKIQNAKHGVLANNPQAQQKFTNSIKPSRFNPLTATADSYADANYKIASTIGRGFWETGDAAKQLPGALRGKDNGFKESLDQSIVGGVGRFGQSTASAALSPVTNRLADQERKRAERLLVPSYENMYRAYGVDPRLGRNQAEIEAGQADYGLRTDPLNRSNIGVNDSPGTTTRKIGAQGAEAALDMLTAPAMALATTTALAKNTSKQFMKNTAKSSLLSGSGNALYAAQQDDVRPLGVAAQFGIGAAAGAALPVTTKLVSTGASNTAKQFKGVPLTDRGQAQRNKLVVGYNEAIASGKPDVAARFAEEIDRLDSSTRAPIKQRIDKRIPKVRADGEYPLGKDPLMPMGKPLPDQPNIQANKSNDLSSRDSVPSDGVTRGMGEDEFFQRYSPDSINRALNGAKPRSESSSLSAPDSIQKNGTVGKYVGTTRKELSEGVKAQTSPKSLNQTSGDNLLPDTIKVKQTTNLDKAFRSTRSIIERQGRSGKKLANKLQESRDTEEIFQANILSRLKNVTKLKGKDYENFIDSVEGNAKPRTPAIAQAVNEWRSVAPEIRREAIDAGVDVGDLGAKYYPHYVDYDKLFKNRNDLNITINHLIKTGQAADPESALELLSKARDVSRNRRMGNLEAARMVNVPIYDKTKNSLIDYISGSSKRIAQAKTFGAQDEIALKMLADLAREGGDTAAATDAFNIAVGAKKYGANGEKVSGTVRNYISTTRLGLGAITNASQSVNTGIVTGHLRTMGAILKQLNPKQRKFVESTGVVADSVIQGIKENTGFTGKVLSKITAPGFGKVEKFNRSVAAIAGRDYAETLAKKGDVAALKKLGVTGRIGKELTENQQIQAARKIVEKTQFKVDAQDLPGWVSSPAGKLVAQFRTFSYNQSKFFSNEILKPAARGNLVPLSRLLAALPVGYGIYETKRMINNREETDENWRKGLEAFGSVGGAGLVLDVFKGIQPLNGKYLDSGRRVSMAVGTFGGPAASTAADVVGSLSDAIQPKNIPKDNPDLEGKAGIKKGNDEYFDATQISRFGMRQVPIVGTRLQNTLLPYKSKSSAKDKLSDNDQQNLESDKSMKAEQKAIMKAAFSTPDGKLFIQQSDNAKGILARQDPERWGELYTQYKAMKKGLSGDNKSSAERNTKKVKKSSTKTKTAIKKAGKKASGKKSTSGKGRARRFDYTKDLFGSSVTSHAISKSLRSILKDAMKA